MHHCLKIILLLAILTVHSDSFAVFDKLMVEQSYDVSGKAIKKWASNGDYSLSIKPRGDGADGGNQFIDIKLIIPEQTKYVYLKWDLPTILLNREPLLVKSILKIEKLKNASFALASNTFIPGFNVNSISVAERVDFESDRYIEMSYDVSNISKSFTKGTLARMLPNIGDSINGVTDKLGIMFYSKGKSEIHLKMKLLQVDGYRAEGWVPEVEYAGQYLRYFNALKKVFGKVESLVENLRYPPGEDTLSLIASIKGKLNNNQKIDTDEWGRLIRLQNNLSYQMKKEKRMASHNNGMTLHVFDATTEDMFAIFNSDKHIEPSNSYKVSMAKNESEAVIVYIDSDQNYNDLSVIVNEKHEKGNGPNVAVFHLHKWYQSNHGSIQTGKKAYRVPELLSKDAGLIKVNIKEKKNTLKVFDRETKSYRYIEPGDLLEDDLVTAKAKYKLQDSVTLSKFKMINNDRRGILIDYSAGRSVTPGLYTYEVKFIEGKRVIAHTEIEVKVNDILLPPSDLEYGIYYRAKLRSGASSISSDWKNSTQYVNEITDMMSLGINIIPLHYQSLDKMSEALALRESVGHTCRNLLILNSATGAPQERHKIRMLVNKVYGWKKLGFKYGCKQVYAYGIDEAKGLQLAAQRKGWAAVRAIGVNIWAACHKNAYDFVGDLLDLVILAGPHEPREVERWHNSNKKVYSYSNPQIGIEEPSIYRSNYGIALMFAGYDGAFPYAYQHAWDNNIWDDFDKRDIALTYPTSNGLLRTLQWYGLREAIDDSRYASLLNIRKGSKYTTMLFERLAGEYSHSKTVLLNKFRSAVVEHVKEAD